MKATIYIDLEELKLIEHIMWHFSDYVAGDNRPDHGLAILKQYREMTEDQRFRLFVLAGKLRRRYRKLRDKEITTENG